MTEQRNSHELRKEIDKLMSEYSEAVERERKADEAYANLNNLYLKIQRGDVNLTRRIYDELQDYLNAVYRHGEEMHDWWWKEFQKLPGWLNV